MGVECNGRRVQWAPPASGNMDRPYLHILTGFLGSGKTTWLNRALAAQSLANTAVVVNEFGAVGIDHLLVEHSTENLVELAGGCLCCAVRGDLALTLSDLLERRRSGGCAPFERIVVETTGLADPNPILNVLATDAALAGRLEFGSVLAVVDAVNGKRTLKEHPEAVKQVVLADRILLSKKDLAPRHDLAAELRALNPRAAIESAAAPARLEAEDSSGVWPAFEAAGHAHLHGIHTFVIERGEALPAAALALLIEALVVHLGPKLLRVKGLVLLEEAPDSPALLQGAQHVFHRLELLPSWPDGKQCTRLVFIVQGEAGRWVETLLDVIVREVRQTLEGCNARSDRP
ncbi:MAG: GTP-binding protein [Gammaproteobacteria bacterium]|nr:GTP-binding protein [Gammaproteobacteria bacterium]